MDRDDRQLGHRPGLDGLRGVAVVLVIAYHAWGETLPGGWIGVDVFFVLSGFLITTMLLEEQAASGRVWLSGFYQRRTLRLVPAVVAFLAVVAGYQMLTDGVFISDLARWAPRFYLTNISAASGIDDRGVAYIWSLAAEEQFYLLWPPLLALLLHRRASAALIVTATAVLALASSGSALMLWHAGTEWPRLYFGPDTHATPILIGCLLAQLWVWHMLPRWTGRAWVFALFILAVVALTISPNERFPYIGGLLLIASAAACIIAAILDDRPVAALLAVAPLRRIGRHSYAMYLWHPFLLHLMTPHGRWWTGVAVLSSYPVAAVSMAMIEGPCLRLKERVKAPDAPLVPQCDPCSPPGGTAAEIGIELSTTDHATQ